MGGWLSSLSSISANCGANRVSKAPPARSRMLPRGRPYSEHHDDVPGIGEDLLHMLRTPGGSFEEKLRYTMEEFRKQVKHTENLQNLQRKRALERRDEAGKLVLPSDVLDVIRDGVYCEPFIEKHAGRCFLIHSEELVPYHEYRLALEVHSGGAYWSSMHDPPGTKMPVVTVGASTAIDGYASVLAQVGSGQRGVVFVWRWHHLPDRGPYNIPEFLSKTFAQEGDDPLQKLRSELDAVSRWELQVRQDTAKHMSEETIVKDRYIKEVLRLWPREKDGLGVVQPKKCAWIEGLDPELFVERVVLVKRVPYGKDHSLELHAKIAHRHLEQPNEGPPYKLSTKWQWHIDGAQACLDEFGDGDFPRETTYITSTPNLDSMGTIW